MRQPLVDAWAAWVGFWDQTEHPRTLAAVRIGLALVLLSSILQVARLDLVVTLMGTADVHGLAPPVVHGQHPSLWYSVLPPTEASAWALWGTLFVSLAALLVGFFTRTAALVAVLALAQWGLMLHGAADRAADVLTRILLLLLAFSGAGGTWSVDAWLKGRFSDVDARVPAWPRYLMIGQLVLTYFLAGTQKQARFWWPEGDYAALWLILQEPTITTMDFQFTAQQPFYFFTQVGSFVTVWWQMCFPLVLLFYWYQATPERPGRLRALANRYHLHLPMVAVGVTFHIGLWLTLQLGIFPPLMLAAYVAFMHPDELGWLLGHRPATEAAPA